MKTKAMIIASMLFTLTVGAQTVNVHLKSGEVVKYDSSVFDYIDFSATETETPVGYTECPDANHPHMIDLGLPSGTKWACCNAGASTPEEYGGYYTFDEAQAYNPPTLDQIKALVNNCSYSWTIQNGVTGGKFTGPNGGTIFLPAAGGRWDGEFYDVGSWGFYWASMPIGEYLGCGLGFGSDNASWDGSYYRNYGFTVRPVR